ncbi:MAG: ATP-binding cassette domain-containing protein [Gammaproteobacteria bacterium]|nr:ATP-binding cassette domain-containing protein [Gammaproteobacteria bacterium]
MLKLDNLSIRRGSEPLFTNATMMIHPGQRVGVTGANGTGKSSLFALIRGDLHADHGDFYRPKDWVIAEVAQETPADPRSAIDYALDGDKELQATLAQLAQAESQHQGERVAELHAKLDAIDGYTARSRAARLIHGLGFKPGEEDNPVNTFSGGWRMRLNLAQALMCRSDLLLLDEPTNHLDLDAVIWLEAWLKSYPGTLLLISHDRDFLDAVSNHIAHIEQGGMTLYSGNYSAFERIRAERLANQQAAHEKQKREVAHIQSYVDRFRAQATKARQAQSRLKALERMQTIAPAHVDSPFHFTFKEPEKTPRPLLTLKESSAGYAGNAIFCGINMTLSPGDRIGLLGPNGAGKSTLIKLLAGTLTALQGKREGAQYLNVGYFAQHQLDQLHPEHTPLEHIQQLDKRAPEQKLRNYLGGFGFMGDKADSPVAPFSGGEKARLVLALLVYQRPNLLLLDEPTNHLDLEMRLALSQALQDFKGAMVVVSHDRHLLRTTTDTLLLVHNERIEEFKGDLDDYPRWLSDNRSDALRQQRPEKEVGDNSANAKKERKRQQAEQRRQLQPLRKQVTALEKSMAQLTERQTQLEQQLADPDIYGAAKKTQLKQLLANKGVIDSELQTAEEQWLEASEALDMAEQAVGD